MPTGTGKTVIFSHIVSNRPGRALVLAHREELIGQAAEKILTVVGVEQKLQYREYSEARRRNCERGKVGSWARIYIILDPR